MQFSQFLYYVLFDQQVQISKVHNSVKNCIRNNLVNLRLKLFLKFPKSNFQLILLPFIELFKSF